MKEIKAYKVTYRYDGFSFELICCAVSQEQAKYMTHQRANHKPNWDNYQVVLAKEFDGLCGGFPCVIGRKDTLGSWGCLKVEK